MFSQKMVLDHETICEVSVGFGMEQRREVRDGQAGTAVTVRLQGQAKVFFPDGGDARGH